MSTLGVDLLFPAFVDGIHSVSDFILADEADEKDLNVVFDSNKLRVVDARLFGELLAFDRNLGPYRGKSKLRFV